MTDLSAGVFPLRPGWRGFSLVEVTIALGLVVFALVSALAILPIGLSTLREAREAVARANILQQVGAEFGAMPFADIPLAQTNYFDLEGRRADSAGFYEVRIRTLTPHYPGMPAGIGDRLKRIGVEILHSQEGTNRPPLRASLDIADSGL